VWIVGRCLLLPIRLALLSLTSHTTSYQDGAKLTSHYFLLITMALIKLRILHHTSFPLSLYWMMWSAFCWLDLCGGGNGGIGCFWFFVLAFESSLFWMRSWKVSYGVNGLIVPWIGGCISGRQREGGRSLRMKWVEFFCWFGSVCSFHFNLVCGFLFVPVCLFVDFVLSQ